jgi:hypothetical protein
MSCANVPTSEFLRAAKALANTCSVPLANNCRGTLDGAVRTGLFAVLPDTAAASCQGKLWVSVTSARTNPLADVERKVTTFVDSFALQSALAASSYIPAFSGPAAVTSLTGVGQVYDGVATNPLPVPPCKSMVLLATSMPCVSQTTAATVQSAL